MNTLHKRFDEWMKENYGIPDGPDETPLGRQIMRVLVWYETEVGHSFDRMRRESITSVEIMALKAIFERILKYPPFNGLN